jgi:transcriptional regulator with XRE-family HTH domain
MHLLSLIGVARRCEKRYTLFATRQLLVVALTPGNLQNTECMPNKKDGLENETVGQRVRRLRKARHLTQVDLSGPGVTNAHVSRIETGDRQPTLGALRQIARKLGVPAEYLEHGIDVTTREELELTLTDIELRVRLEADTESVERDAKALVTRAESEGEPDVVARARATLGMALASSGRLADAILELEAAAQHPLIRPELFPDVYTTLIASYRQSGRSDEAVVACERTLDQVAPENGPLRMLLATHLSHALSDLGEFERAKVVLEQYGGDFEQSDPYAQARMHWGLARVAAMRNERRLALRHMRQAITLLRGTEDTIRLAGAHIVCAQILLWGGTTAGVEKHLGAARALLPSHAEAGDHGTLRGLEALLAARHRDFEEARQAAEEALFLMPEHTPEIAPALYAKALAAAGEGDYEIADEAYRSVLDLAKRSELWQEAALIARDWSDMLRWAGRPYDSDQAAGDADRYASEAQKRARQLNSA